MQRVPEPEELMDDPAQAQAYARADFEAPHSAFIQLLQQHCKNSNPVNILELGCGTGDITWRLAEAFPDSHIDALDGAQAMLRCAATMVEQHALHARVQLLNCYLPTDTLGTDYDAVFCNATLHHLHDPRVLWQTLQHAAAPGADIFIMDLSRPDTAAQARKIVDTHAADESEILKEDFYNSLLAAYTVNEVRAQLNQSGLHNLQVCMATDRHWIVAGKRI